MGVGVNFALLKKNSPVTPNFYSFFLKGYIKDYEKNFEIVNARFLRVHSITFYIKLSSKLVGVGANVALLKENLSGDPHFFILFF